MRRGETIAESIEGALDLLELFSEGFDDSNRTSQAPGLPNHFAWTLGHCALAMHEVAHFIDDGPLPAQDFASPGKGNNCFVEEEIAFGSSPRDDADAFPGAQRCLEIHRRACDRLIKALRNASDQELDREVPWGVNSKAVGTIAQRMAIHTGMHIGQLIDLRRALGVAPLFMA